MGRWRRSRKRATQSWARLAFVVAVAVGTSGCALFDVFGSGDSAYEGQIAFGFEVAAFHRCSSTEQWWITGDAGVELQNQYSRLGLDQYELAFARVEGKPSSPGTYGHLGAYQREFEVTAVLEVREIEAGDCD